MKTFFTILVVAIFAVSFNSFSANSTDKQKAILSYSLPSKLDWKQSTDEGMEDDRQLYTLEDDASIKIISLQAGNQNIWGQISGKDKKTVFDELSKGKKAAQKLAGYKDWQAESELIKKSDKEVIFEMTGSYVDGKEKKFFSEKYYVTPYGFVMISLDWNDKSDKAFVKKAQSDFENISFKTELK